jgi:tRNA nucleotidyltransferase (CCA-adding enzyme)
MQKKVPDYVMKILSSLETGGYPAYLAGGCVRDLFMSKTPSDWDVATAATPDIVSGLFDKTFHTGRKYGTVTVVVGRNAVEVTTFRSESGYLKHRWPENVVFSDDLHADLSRRDFTVNAIAMSARGEITDLFCGREDIRNKVIRCVGDPAERFSEDALRMFRALRFSAVLGFSIERETGEAIAQNAGLAAEISAERISAEVEKIIMSDRPETMERLISYGLLDKYLDGKGRGARGMDKISSLPASRGYRWTAYAALLLNLGCVTNPRAHLHSMRLDRKLIKNCAIAANLSQNPLPRDRI